MKISDTPFFKSTIDFTNPSLFMGKNPLFAKISKTQLPPAFKRAGEGVSNYLNSHDLIFS